MKDSTNMDKKIPESQIKKCIWTRITIGNRVVGYKAGCCTRQDYGYTPKICDYCQNEIEYR
jgi:hypothetical protein